MESLSAIFLARVVKLVYTHAHTVGRTEVKTDGISVSNISSVFRDASRHNLLN